MENWNKKLERKLKTLRAATVFRISKVGSSPISRTKIPVTPYGVTGIFCAEMGLESPAQAKRGYKTVRWTVL